MPSEEKVMRHVEYCTELLHRFSYSFDKVHVAVNEKWVQLIASKFDFLAGSEMTQHMELVSTLVEAYKDYRGWSYVESVYQVWYGGLSRYIRDSSTSLPPHIRASLVDVGTTLAAVLILHAEYHRAIICLNDVLFLDSSKSTARLAILRLASMTGEWQILRELLKREATYAKFPETVVHKPFVKLYALMLRIHFSDERLTSEEISAKTSIFHTKTVKEFADFEGAALEHEVRVMASCLPEANLTQHLTVVRIPKAEDQRFNDLRHPEGCAVLLSFLPVLCAAFLHSSTTLEPEERRTRTLDVEYHFAKVVVGRYDERSFEKFCTSWDVLHPALLELNRRTRKQFSDPSRALSEGLSWMQTESYVDIICRCTSRRNDAQATELRKKAFKHVEHAPTELRPYWLLLKFSMDREDTFASFNHLFLKEWRYQICSYLARSSTSQAERAFYLSEATLCSVRQTARAYYANPGESYSYSSESEFMDDVRKLPAELTVVQLFIDHTNTLWLSRLHRSLEPFTLALLNLDDDDVVSKMRDVVATISESGKEAPAWTKLIRLDKKVGNIVKAMEKKWFGYWRSMLLPHSDEAAKGAKDNFAVLILSEGLSVIPFETMPIFKDHPLVCRAPSFKLLCNLLRTTKEVPRSVKGEKSYYILNPGGDLKESERKLGDIMESYKFDGIRGEAPNKEKIKEVLSRYDVLLYMGHGSGLQYFGRQAIRTSECKAVPILMGCESVRIECNGSRFDGQSVLYDYMIARCPCVIGCLWTVFGGDIDKYLAALLKYCFSHLLDDRIAIEKGYRSVLRWIAEARKACRLPYLTGAAVVAYGLPIISKID
uniref:separase n=1 Tax=Steinernema glaseri TaxID=37863 RepID=A0A1I7Z134_9BILA